MFNPGGVTVDVRKQLKLERLKNKSLEAELGCRDDKLRRERKLCADTIEKICESADTTEQSLRAMIRELRDRRRVLQAGYTRQFQSVCRLERELASVTEWAKARGYGAEETPKTGHSRAINVQ